MSIISGTQEAEARVLLSLKPSLAKVVAKSCLKNN
jgi:hypothetical protein